MRMVVVLPLPLAPRKPQISPLRDFRLSHRRRVRAEALAQVVDVDDEAVHRRRDTPAARARHGCPLGRTATGWPGLISIACSRDGRASTM